jgi:AraC-like DNA-binding protein
MPREIEMTESLARAEAGLASADDAAQPAAYRSIAFVTARYHEKFAASIVAEHCGLSRFQFSRNFHSTFGITFREYLLRFRIREACRRLQAGEQSVTGIAYAVGFHDGSYFARMFRRYVGVLPSQYAARRDAAARSDA